VTTIALLAHTTAKCTKLSIMGVARNINLRPQSYSGVQQAVASLRLALPGAVTDVMTFIIDAPADHRHHLHPRSAFPADRLSSFVV